MLSNPGKPVTVYSVASIIGRSFSKAFTKHNIDVVSCNRNNLNENTGEDEFLFSYVTDRPYSQVTEPVSVPSSSKDNHEEGTSAVFMEVSPEIIRPFPKDRPRKTRGKSMEKAGS